MGSIRKWAAGLALLGSVAAGGPAAAEEGGSGHYQPGQNGFLAGVLPAQPGWYINVSNSFYSGGRDTEKHTPIGGLVVQGFNTTTYCSTPCAMWVSPKKVLGATFVPSLSLPLIAEYNRSLDDRPSGTIVRTGNGLGIGDITINPVSLGWTTGNQHVQVGLNVYAPTGGFRQNDIVQFGKNFWTTEPFVGYTYLNPKDGWEFSGLFGYDFNTINSATRYLSGQQAHLDWTVAKHFSGPHPPAAAQLVSGGRLQAGSAPSGTAGGAAASADPGGAPPQGQSYAGIAVGLGGYFYQQLTPDSGRGAVLGPFKARAFGMGPQIQATAPILGTAVTFQFKIQQEFGVENRPAGTLSWFNVFFGL